MYEGVILILLILSSEYRVKKRKMVRINSWVPFDVFEYAAPLNLYFPQYEARLEGGGKLLASHHSYLSRRDNCVHSSSLQE